MRRISSHIPLIAALVSLWLTAGVLATSIATAAQSAPPVSKAALNKAVQEALAKAKLGAGAGAGAQGPTEAGASPPTEGFGSSGALSKLTGPSSEEETETPTPATNAATSASSISSSVLLPIFVLGALLLAGIAFFIVRDARSVAPVADGPRGGDSAQDRAARLRKQRARAKAARQQRKRNR